MKMLFVAVSPYGLPFALQAYLVDVQDYEMMKNRMEILDGIAKGETAIIENRLYTQAEAKEKMSKWLK